MGKSKLKKESSTKCDKEKLDKTVNKKSAEKKNADQHIKKYAVITPESVSLIGDSIGIDNICEEALSGLAEDLSYRLREIIHYCSVHVHNNKRRILTTDDVNRVLETSHTSKIYGHSVGHGLDFTFIPKAEVYVENDVEIDIVAMSQLAVTFSVPGDEYVKDTWLLPEIVQKEKKEEASTSTATSTVTSAAAPSPEEQIPLSKPPEEFINYYMQVARVLLSNSQPQIWVALADLSTNSKIGPVVPYILNLVCLVVKKLLRHVQLINTMLRTVEALLNNPYVDLSSHPVVDRIVNVLQIIAVQARKAEKVDLLLHDKAAQLLPWVVNRWSIDLSQQSDIVRKMPLLLLNVKMSLITHYGAIVVLTSFGQQTLYSHFWPIIDRYVTVLEKHPGRPQHKQYVKDAIVKAYEKMHQEENTHTVNNTHKKIWLKVETVLNELLGDTLVPRFRVWKREKSAAVYPVVTDGKKFTDFSQPEMNTKQRESLIAGHSSCSGFMFRHLGSQSIRQPQNLEVKSIESPLKMATNLSNLYMHSVFIVQDNKSSQRKEIDLNFIGSKQKSVDVLKRRKIGESIQESYNLKFAQIWNKIRKKKNTKIKKTCSLKSIIKLKSHMASNAGDLFVFL